MSATTQANAAGTTSLLAPGSNTNSTSSLWDTANAKLDPRIQKILATVNTGSGRIVDAVLDEAVTQQRVLAAKRWKMTIRGKEVILRDVLGKIIRWIDHYKAVGDIAVQFNSGAASLPWAAVRFLLQVAVDDKQYLEATIEGIEIVTQTIATYAAVETLYMDSNFQLHTQIRSKVLGLYVHILSFLGESIRYSNNDVTMIDESLQGTSVRSFVLYYYCGDIQGHGGKCDAKDVMRSLLRQLSVQNEETFEIVEQVHLEFKRREARGKIGMGNMDKLEPHECTHWIAELLQTDQVTIIIDAIDEIDVADRHLLLNELIALRDDPVRIVKMLLSSRDDTNISRWLEGATELRLQASLTQADMQQFIGHCISTAVNNKHLLDGKEDPPLQSRLESYLLDRADGMFRWVELQLRHFCDLKWKRSIEQAMSDPSGASIHTVDHLYAKIFDQILKTDPLAYEVAAQTFRLIMCLHETLSPATLLAAASITRDGIQSSLELSDLLRICSHLVVLDDELDTIRFAHASVQEYLSRLPAFSMMDANSAAASSCLIRCIDSPLPDLTLGVQPSHDFDVYAAMYWPLHYNAASEHDRNGRLVDVLKEFMFSDQEYISPFPSWIETVGEIVKALSRPHTRLSDLIAIGSESATPFFTACLYGLEFAIEILSGRSSFDVNQKNSHGLTGLYLASATGQIRVVNSLLKLGADIAIEGGRSATPLQAACANGHGDIAQLIIEFPSRNTTAETIVSAIQAALRNGHEDVAVILLEKSVLPFSQDTLDRVFEAAAGMGFTELMDSLHSTSKSPSGTKKSSIKDAIRVFQDSKIDRFRNYFKTKALPNDAIATAAFDGQNKIIEFCLDKGLDIEHEGPFGTPLRAASLMGHGTTVRLLLDKNAAVNANGTFGDALQAAAMRGHLSITTTLIRSGAAVDNSGGYYGNALQAATYRGHIDVVKALLAAGASIGQKGLFNDALSAAVSAGDHPIANMLLRSGYRSPHFLDEDEVNEVTMRHRKMGPPSHVDLLSELDSAYHSRRTRQADRAKVIRGRDVSFEEAYKKVHDGVEVESVTELADSKQHQGYGSQALLLATETGQESIVRSMLDHRFAIGLSLLDIGIVLKAASAAGRLGIVDYILLLPDLPRKHIPRALERAAWYGHVAVTKRLLECEEAYGPPPHSRYAPFTPRGQDFIPLLTSRRLLVEESCKDDDFPMGYRQLEEVSSDKESRWSDYFPVLYQVVKTNETTGNGHIMRILLLGCRANTPATVEFALQLAAESELQDVLVAALGITIESDSERALEVLLRHYPVVHATVLKKACAQAEGHSSFRALYVLLAHNSDHGYQLQDYWKVFQGAAITKHSALISYLCTQTLNWQEDSVFARHFVEAAQRGYASAMDTWEIRLCQVVDHKLLMSQALDQACANGHAVVVSYLIERGVDVNALVEKAVQPSRPGGYYSTSRKRDGVTKNEVWPRTALQACLQATPQCDRIHGSTHDRIEEFRDEKRNFLSKQQAVIELLLDKKANVNAIDSHGRSALHSAALCCPLETVQMILENGAAIDILDKANRTPLFYAAWREIDSLAVFEVLTKAEAHATSRSAPRTSPTLLLDATLSTFREGFIESESVHQVLTTGPGAAIRYLLQSQPDLQATATGFTLLLQMASADGDMELVQLLIERNVDVKAVAHHYGTALHAAARFGHLECVKLLVEAGTEIALTAGISHWTPLRAAVEGQYLAVVHYLLDLGAMQSCNISTDQVSTEYGGGVRSMLTLACHNGNIEIATLLLFHPEHNTLKPDQTETRRTQFMDMSRALHEACENGHADIAALLIEYGVDVEEKSGQSLSPLTSAATAGNLETMKILLAAGATLYDAERAINILRTLVVGEKPKDVIDFVIARLLGTDDFIHACKEVPAYMRAWQEDARFVLHVDTLQNSEKLLVDLTALGAQQSIELLLDSSIKAADVKPAVLQAAAYFQSFNVLFRLLPIVVIPQPFPSGYHSPVYALLEGLMPIKSKTGRSLISLCCETWAKDSFLYPSLPGQPEKECTCNNTRSATNEAIMKLAQIDDSHICATAGTLHLASYLGMLQVVQVCLELGVDINQHHDSFGSALIAGIEGASLEVVTLLLQRHIDVNATASELGTPLYPTYKTQQKRLQAFANPSTPSPGTALHKACQNGNLEMTEVLLEHGAEVNVSIPGKGTPVDIACERRDEKLLKLLLTFGADIDIVSPDLGSALHVACKSHDSGLVRILLQHGANVNMFSSNHGTPLHVACAGNGDHAIIQLLLDHGADLNSEGSKGETPLTSILSQDDKYFSERLVDSLLKTEQKLNATENDLNRLVSSTSGIQACKRALADNTHLQPTTETIRSLLAGIGYHDSDILRLLLARAPHLEITLDMVKKAGNLENFKLLTQHGSCTKITADLMESFLDPLELDLIKYSVQSAPEVKPPPAVVKAVRAIVERPEPKSDGTHEGDLWVSFVQYRQGIQKPKAKEIMDLVVTRYPDVLKSNSRVCVLL
ncbi:hypothetical protein J4E90_005193 [Alternaria incomplexa]|uniref:uncharacterized protein n=1 Tax=Alternaria incomplexa TaxID=1187928 RepID=UPI00221F8A1D|nr:uncharacterized protein J4E90_005193 [Alternaria incomplexa]KAI4913476.1 hypothetical protein J4E90_005193 [Alternaria incomplexa]